MQYCAMFPEWSLDIMIYEWKQRVRSVLIAAVVFSAIDPALAEDAGRNGKSAEEQITEDEKRNMENCIAEKLDKHFFRALNPAALPAGYADAIRKNDKKTALHIAIEYFRNRPASAYFANLKARAFERETANRAVRGEITVVNIPYAFPGGKVDFLYDPTAPTGVHNPEWQWQINRMSFWNDMALSYLNQPDETLAAAFAQQLRDWVLCVPFPKPPLHWNGCGSAWRTIETGLRLMGSWQVAFEIFRKSPTVTDETLALMLASMHEQTQHVMTRYTSKNWLMMELNGAHTFAAVFPEFNGTVQIRRKSASLLSAELKKQLLPDGMQNELSPDYHSVVFGCATMLYRIAKLNNCLADLPADYAANRERAADAVIQLMTPGFTQPRTNDCYTMHTPVMLKKISGFFPEREDFLWVMTHGESGKPPAGKTPSRFLPWAGFVAMRSSWDKDATYLCFDVGPLGAAHFHQDKLNINIYKGSEELLFDDGGGQYESSPYRLYGISAAGHNTILVDGTGQNRRGPKVVRAAIDANYFTGEKFDYACGTYSDTFGAKMVKSATHKREVLFVKPDFFAVADTMKSRDGKAHDYTMLLQMETLDVKTTPSSIHGVLSGEYDLYILPLSENVKITVESGKKKPVSGWFVGRNDKALHPASTVKITAKQQMNHRFVTLLFPLKKGTALPTAERISETDWKITFAGENYTLNLADLKKNFATDQ